MQNGPHRSVLLISLLVLISLCSFVGCSEAVGYSRIEKNHPGGSFDQEITTNTEIDSFSFLVLSDIHFGRTEEGVYWAFDEFFEWVDEYQNSDEYPLDFALSLGDGTAYSKEWEYQKYADFIMELENRSIRTNAVLGNHDVRNIGREYFTQYINPSTARRFSHKGLSFYLLDTGNASLGKNQLDNLVRAAREDPNPKIFCSHFPVYGGPDTFYFSLSNPHERALLLQTMVESKTGLYLAGHLHLSSKIYHFTDTTTEFVCESFHGRNSLFESTLPVWYVLTYQAESHAISIVKYSVTNAKKIVHEEKAIINLPR